ncbi:hypothetical protein ACIGO9_27380 [Nocardia asteroides]|uniref:hypothetical protein n=1 Tax=Nocardia asteroides TaxID=1824 RepID=UPI0037CA73C2
MRTATAWFAALITVGATALAGCSGWIHEGPTNQEIKDGTGMTVAEAKPIVAQNFTLIWPDPTTVELGNIRLGNGCRTDPNSLRAAGPPWTPYYEKTAIDPDQEFVDRALANLEAMTAHGFTRVPDPVPGDDPANRSYEDSRGFSVAVQRHQTSRETRFTMTASSPCAAE